jgi:hypothetical protein
MEDLGLSDHSELLFQHVSLGKGLNDLTGPFAGVAGGGYTYKCDARFYQFIHSVIFTYTADATVGSRVISANFVSPDGAIVGATPAIGTLTAGQAGTVFMSPDNKSTLGAIPGTLAIWLPRFVLKPGWQFQIVATNQGVGDVISAVYFNIQSYSSLWASGTEREDTEQLVLRLARLLASGR